MVATQQRPARIVVACARLSLVTVLMLALAVPAGAVGSEAGQVEALDYYETTYGPDDTWQQARDVTSFISGNWWEPDTHWFGSDPRDEWHSIDWVQEESGTVPPSSDEDWVKFEFTAGDYYAGYSYLFEAVGVDSLVDPVLEVYGPNTAYPTAPGDLIASSETTSLTQLDPSVYAGADSPSANDDGVWFGDRSASVSFIPEDTGVYYVRVRPYYQYAGGIYEAGFRNGTGRYRLRFKIGQMTRVSGDNRLRTAVAVSKERFPSFGPAGRAAVLASGYSFPDALSGSTLAGAVGGPILLTYPDKLSSYVGEEIARLDVETVYIMGGTSAVSSAVQSTIEQIGVTPTRTVEVVRVAGDKRTETARLAALEAAKITPTAPVAFVANSKRFPDALAASSMAAYNVAPVLLTPATSLDAEVVSALNDPALGIDDVVIVGGESVVSATVEAQIAAALGGSSHVRRIAGRTRYATARDFAIWATGWEAGANPVDHVDRVGTSANPTALETLEFNRVGLSNGEDFPDALAGGAFCGLARAPILLTKPRSMSPYVLDYLDPSPIGSRDDYWGAAPYAFVRSYVFGGPAAVDDSVFRTFDIWTGPGPY